MSENQDIASLRALSGILHGELISLDELLIDPKPSDYSWAVRVGRRIDSLRRIVSAMATP